jgi:hypothetical protein
VHHQRHTPAAHDAARLFAKFEVRVRVRYKELRAGY